MLFYFSLSVLVLVFGASRFSAGRPFSVNQLILIKRIFLFAILIIFSLLTYYSYRQYIVWASAEPSKFLLPPYQSWNYFFGYVGLRFFSPYIISLVAAFAFLHIAKNLNKKFNERFFYEEEIWLGALALFLIGWPGALFYFIGLVSAYLIIHLFSFAVNRESLVISLYYLWIPIAIIVIIINNWLIELEWWKLLKV